MLVVPTDVTDSEACERLVAATIEEYGHVDVLVNNVGGGLNKSPEKWTVAEWHQVIDLNLASVWFMSRLVATPMLEQGRGAIVNISSGASFLALPMHAPYGAAKAGMNSLTRSLAAAWTGGGVRVNAVACGAVKTEGYNQSTTRQQQPDDVVLGPATRSGGWADPKRSRIRCCSSRRMRRATARARPSGSTAVRRPRPRAEPRGRAGRFGYGPAHGAADQSHHPRGR